MPSTIRIANGCGFWGDNIDAPIVLAERGEFDYLTLEYLAELTMSILALQRQRKPDAGFAHDFLDVLQRLCLVPSFADGTFRIITNAGGMNPQACALSARAILDQNGLTSKKVAVVDGDDLLPRLDELLAQGHDFANLDTGEPLSTVRDRIVSANAYLGAWPIVEALQQGAEIIITGRVADASLTVAPTVHELGWTFDDVDLLSSATVAGHLIECGAQVTGGLWCNWQETDLADVGYPIAEIDTLGNVRITKPPQTGGAVNIETVSEQLLYEVGDPANYLTPDVVADFTTVTLRQAARDIVEITPAKGKPPTEFYKVSIAYRDGFTSSGTLLIYGLNAAAKAQAAGDMILQRLQRAGFVFDRTHIECLGAGDCVPIRPLRDDLDEVVLRVAVHDTRREAVERFSKEFAPLVTSGPPGVTGYTTGRPAVREVFAYWPALIHKQAVQPRVQIL